MYDIYTSYIISIPLKLYLSYDCSKISQAGHFPPKIPFTFLGSNRVSAVDIGADRVGTALPPTVEGATSVWQIFVRDSRWCAGGLREGFGGRGRLVKHVFVIVFRFFFQTSTLISVIHYRRYLLYAIIYIFIFDIYCSCFFLKAKVLVTGFAQFVGNSATQLHRLRRWRASALGVSWHWLFWQLQLKVRKVGGLGLVGLTPWKINMEPKHGGLEDDFAFQLGDF